MSNRTNTEYDGLQVNYLPTTFLVYVCPPGCCRDPVHTQPRELQASGGLSGQDGDGDQHEALRHRDHQLPEDGVQTGGPRQLYLLSGAEEESPQSHGAMEMVTKRLEKNLLLEEELLLAAREVQAQTTEYFLSRLTG